jgi:glycerate kinase
MRFLIAPDKFKRSLTAREVAENIALGIRDVSPDAGIEIAPVADGGEGTAEILCRALGGEWVNCAAHDALGRAITARYVWIEKAKTAVIETSAAIGLQRLRPDESDPGKATTFGAGEMIASAISRGANQIIVGLGGSATNDGGFGMLRALGFRFFAKEQELTNGPIELNQLTRIVRSQNVVWPKIVAAVDVQNPLLGENGATNVFAAQKGATPEQIVMLETALTKFAETIAREFGRDRRDEPGAGAAGGLGFGLASFCDAQLQAGFKVVADAIGLTRKIHDTDIVITGEGRLDKQTMEGKAPAGVAKMARESGKPVYAIVGEILGGEEVRGLFNNIVELVRPPMSRAQAMQETGKLLRERAAELVRRLKNSR